MKEKISELLQQQSMSRAVIIDDAYDPPSSGDVTSCVQAFIDSLRQDADYEVVAKVLEADDLSEDDLLHRLEHQATIDVLFGSEKKLPDGAWEALFGTFMKVRQGQEAELEPIVNLLTDCGFKVDTLGSHQLDSPPEADLVLVDLFFDDSMTAVDAARNAAEKLLCYRRTENELTKASVPLVVLISSRQPELREVYAEFRDSAGIAGCRFAFAEKRLFRQQTDEACFRLHQLIQYNPSSVKFEHFIKDVEQAAQSAMGQFIKILRRFELSDYADLTDLVVSVEGVPLKDYLLELYALSWASIAEADPKLISALDNLNSLELTVDNYPPNTFEPSDAVLELYELALYRPAETLEELSAFGDLRLGDVLVCSASSDAQHPEIFLVIAQDCDMLRDDPPDSVFLIKGMLYPRSNRPKEKVYPFRYMGERFTVAWSLKKWRALRRTEFDDFAAQNGITRSGRLRSPWSLSLQRDFLQRLSRPVEIAKPHDIEAVDFEVLIKGENSRCVRIFEFADTARAFLLEARDSDNKTVIRLVISPSSAQDLRGRLREIMEQDTDEQVSSEVKDWLRGLLEDPVHLESFRTRLSVEERKRAVQTNPFEAISTVLSEQKHWKEGDNAHQCNLMVNIRQFDPQKVERVELS